MRSLDRKAARTLRALAAQGKAEIETAGIPSLAVRLDIACRTEHYTLLALTHYEQIGGQRFRAPEMLIAYRYITRRFIPISYRNDLLRIDDYSMIPAADGLYLRSAELQAVHTRTAARWLHRIGRRMAG